MSKEVFEHDRSRSQCFYQIQLVTCCDLSDFFHEFEVYSKDFSESMGDFPEGLELQPVTSQTRPVQSVTSGLFSLFIVEKDMDTQGTKIFDMRRIQGGLSR